MKWLQGLRTVLKTPSSSKQNRKDLRSASPCKKDLGLACGVALRWANDLMTTADGPGARRVRQLPPP